MRDLGTVGLWLVREYSSRRSKVYTGYGFWIDSFRPFRNLRWTKISIRKIPSIRVFEYSRILQSLSLPFDLRSFIHYTPLGAINFFVRITEIRSVKLVSSIANGPTKWPSKAFSYLIDSNRWSVGNRAEYREVLCRVPRSYRWFSRWFNAFRPIVNSALI